MTHYGALNANNTAMKVQPSAQDMDGPDIHARVLEGFASMFSEQLSGFAGPDFVCTPGVAQRRRRWITVAPAAPG